MESPLIYDELKDVELKAQFKALLTSINHLAQTRTRGDEAGDVVIAFIERIRQEVTTKPILARIHTNNTCLLNYALVLFDETRILDSEISAIEVLIDANPSALLWETYDGQYPINIISSLPRLCSLMPWIAANHQWVLDHESIIDDPPVMRLIKLFKSEIDQTRSRYIAETIRQFIEIYPHSLSQQDSNGGSPLHLIVLCPECEVDLVKKMVELRPSSTIAKTNNGCTPLHVATYTLASNPGENLKEICKHLISECPESVRCVTSIKSILPIHMLRSSQYQHQAVREVGVSLLRAYPESYDIKYKGSRAPSSDPFIQHANSLLVEERALQENIDQLQLIPGAFDNAVECTRDELIKSTSTVFNSWARSSIQAMESKIELNSSLLQHVCEYFITGYPNESDDE